jgi:GT2 family glycosyltransferase
MEREGEESQLPRVLVAILSEGSEHLEASIVSVFGQDYPSLEVLVVDVGVGGRIDEVAEVAAAHDIPVIAPPKGKGLAAGANAVLYEPVDHCDWVIFIHDEVALEPSAVRLMIESALESGAAIVGPKVRDWNRVDVLREMGFGCDRYGYHRSQVDPGESDRGQHDLLKDTFFVSTTCMAVRLDALTALGGFDSSLDSLEEDLDLCWRARLLGLKVAVVPSAVAYHDPSPLDVPRIKNRDSIAARNRMRILTKCYRPRRLLATLVSLLVQDAAEVLFRAVTGRPPRVLEKLGVWARYVLGLGSTLRARSAVQKSRVASDSAIAEMQTRGSLRIRSALERQMHRESLEEGAGPPQGLQSAGSGVWEFLLHELTRPAVVFWIVWAIFVLVASRNLIFSRAAPIVGEIGVFDRGAGTLRGYFSAWHPEGVGYSGYAPSANLIAGIAQVVALGRPVAPIKIFLPIAFVLSGAGVWTLVRRISGSTRWEGAAVATILYSLSAPVVASYERGSLSGIVTTALIPWALALLFGPILGRKGYIRCTALLALATFVMTSFEPAAPLLVLAGATGAAAASVVAGKFVRSLAALAMAIAGVAAGSVLVAPWALGNGTARQLASEIFGGWADGRVQLGVGGALRMQTTELGAAPFGYALAALGLAALFLCRGERLSWVGRVLFAAAIPAVGVWLAGQGVLPAVLESFPAVFALTAVGFSVAAGLGIDGLRERATDEEKPSTIARILLWPAMAAVLVAAGPAAIQEVGGSLGTRQAGIEKSLEDAQATADSGPISVLWIGSQEALPGNPRPLPGGMGGAYSVTGALPGPGLSRTAPKPDDFESTLSTVLSQMQSEGFTRGGKLLAALGVRYVAVPDAPGSYPVGSRPAPDGIVEGLARQLDVAEVRGLRGMRLFRVGHESAVWTATAADTPVAEAAFRPVDRGFRRWLDVELTAVAPVFDSVKIGSTGTLDTREHPAVIVFKQCDERLYLAVNAPGQASSEIHPRKVLGWACIFELSDERGSGRNTWIELRQRPEAGFRNWLLLQMVGIVFVLALAAVARPRSDEDYLPERLAALGEVEEMVATRAPAEPEIDDAGETE